MANRHAAGVAPAIYDRFASAPPLLVSPRALGDRATRRRAGRHLGLFARRIVGRRGSPTPHCRTPLIAAATLPHAHTTPDHFVKAENIRLGGLICFLAPALAAHLCSHTLRTEKEEPRPTKQAMKNVWEPNFAVSAISREPVISKTTHRGENDRLEYAVSSMQGYRVNMEDAHATIGDLDASTATSFFGVYDGHGGPAVSKFCAQHLHVEVRHHPEFKDNLPIAVASAFVRMDQMMMGDEGRRELSAYCPTNNRKLNFKDMLMNCACLKSKKYPGPVDVGSTACVALIRGDQIIVGNAGDCRCVLSRNGQAIILTTDHKPSVPTEKQRIENAGRSVTVTGGASRIDNGIAVSRSIGDLRYKTNSRLTPAQQALTSFPEIRIEKITDDTEFLVMACDGVWDVVLNQGLIEIIRGNMKSGKDLGKICESILDMCVEPPQPSVDNMTILLVRFKHAAQAPAMPQHYPKAPEQSGADDDLRGKNKGKGKAAVPARRSF